MHRRNPLVPGLVAIAAIALVSSAGTAAYDRVHLHILVLAEL